MKKEWKKLILIVLVIVAVLAYLSQKGPLYQSSSITKTAEVPKPQVTLSVQPQVSNLKSGEEVSVAVLAHSPEGVLAIDLDLNFDPQTLSIKKITPGDFFTEPMVFYEKTDTKKGTILYSLGSLKPSNNQGIIANITFRVKSATGGPLISFGSRTLASVKGAREAQIVVQ